MWFTPISRDAFRDLMNELEGGSDDCSTHFIRQQWTGSQIAALLRDPDPSVRRLACRALGLSGDRRICGVLASALKDRETPVHEEAERALWAIWFRSGNGEAQKLLRQGMRELSENRPGRALPFFQRARQADPDFAEAYHQSAIAHDLLEQWDKAMMNSWHAVGLVPVHFGAWASLGRCYTHLGETDEAVECYRQALRIHPHMSDVAFALGRLQQQNLCDPHKFLNAF